MNNSNITVLPAKAIFWKKILGPIVVIVVLVFGLAVWRFSNIFSSFTAGSMFRGNKMCSGVGIYFFAGGGENDTFANVVFNGARAAESDLGAKVTYVWSNWDSELMTSQFKDAVSKLPDAIAMMGHPGASALGPLIDEAERKGIFVTLQNVDIPTVREKYVSHGFGYVGQTLYNSGFMVANGLVRKYGPLSGSEAIVFGVDKIADPSRYERTKGGIDGLAKDKLVVHEVTIPTAVQKDATSAAAKKMFADAFAKYPKAKVVLIDHGALTASAPGLLKSLGKTAGEITIAGFDLSPETVGGIRDGYIGLILDQQPYLQGYLPILQACMSKKYGFSGLNIDTGTGLIDATNVDAVADLATKKIR